MNNLLIKIFSNGVLIDGCTSNWRTVAELRSVGFEVKVISEK